MKKQYAKLTKAGSDAIAAVYAELKKVAAEREIVLFDPDAVDTDEVYNYPSAYTVDKHDFHISGVVQKIAGDKFTMFKLGEEFGETDEYPIDELEVWSAIELLKYL